MATPLRSNSPYNDKVILITGATGSQLGCCFARYWLEALHPRAVVIVDSDYSRLEVLMSELIEIAWSVSDDGSHAESSSDEDNSLDTRTGHPTRGRETDASPGGRSFAVPALISNLIRPDSYPGNDQAQRSITQVKSVCADLNSFPAALRAVKETVADFGRLDYIFTFPSSTTLHLLDEISRNALTTTKLVPIMAAPPYQHSEEPNGNMAGQGSGHNSSGAHMMNIDGGHGYHYGSAERVSTPDMKDPRVRGSPLADIHWQLFDRMTRELANMLHAAIPALICPPRPLRSNLLNASVPATSIFPAWSTSWHHESGMPTHGANLPQDGERLAEDGQDRTPPTQWTGANFRLSDKFFVAVMLPAAEYGRMRGSPYYEAGLAACRSLLSSYAPLVPLPTPLTDEALLHPPVPRINLKIFDREAAENDVLSMEENPRLGGRQGMEDLMTSLVRSLERL
ncbi:hypothetical protein OC846_004365 [Tilletia horrida]|uniref:Uncharacterized protein n=1 Tax=Tilletia horrida TaxID=155126 RepID=A0AAN6GME3_9BASI|nr:hypothetical protein OC846_004365 [Tilletia horrida]KAK0563853.1 hypothetical protein OC861_004593 [Tilletia horrida]